MILVTGNTGYIGTVMTRYLQERSYDVVGLDYNYFEGCDMFPPEVRPTKQIVKNINDVCANDLEGVSAIIHLAALSNDPLGEINPSLTDNINFKASVRLAELAKEVGIQRYIYSSSCSLYGIAADDSPLTEEGRFNPITAYAKSKVDSEAALSKLASDDFHPTYMRNATVYGISPNLRMDLVVNNLTAWAYLTGKVAIMSDGTPWRPIVHVKDLCSAFLAALEAPVDVIHNEAFNVGINEENYQIKDIAHHVEDIVPDCKAEIQNKMGSDERTYRVDFTKIKTRLPEFRPKWDVRKGIEEIYNAYKKFDLTVQDFESAKYFRLRWIRHLLENKMLDNNLRWINNE